MFAMVCNVAVIYADSDARLTQGTSLQCQYAFTVQNSFDCLGALPVDLVTCWESFFLVMWIFRSFGYLSQGPWAQSNSHVPKQACRMEVLLHVVFKTRGKADHKVLCQKDNRWSRE